MDYFKMDYFKRDCILKVSSDKNQFKYQLLTSSYFAPSA